MRKDGRTGETLTLDDFNIEVHQFVGEHHLELWRGLVDWRHNTLMRNLDPHLVTEAFTFRQHATDGSFGKAKVELISCEYIGILKLFSEQCKIPMKSYMSSEGKGFATDLKLEKLGWFQTPKTPKRHMNDAVRQAVCYIVKELKIYSPLTDTWKD
jgi:hypothetical protein